MKRWILITVIVFLLTSASAIAADSSVGFATAQLPEDEITAFLENVDISILANEPSKKPIECFSVSENGLIAIGYNNLHNKIVCIYTSTGIFQYGYNFKCDGSFGIELDDHVLNIYFVRSNIAVAVDSAGEVISTVKILDTWENTSYWNDSVFATKSKVGNTEYSLTNDMGFLNLFASSYSRLTMTNEEGSRIIHDVNSYQLLRMIVAFAAVSLFVLIAMVVIVRQFRKLNQ